MGALSNYLEEAVLNHVFRNIALGSPATTYLALYTTDPGEADAGVEVSGGAYARQAVTFGAPSQVGGKATIKNSVEIVFPVATADWGLIVFVGVRDTLTVGNLLYYGPMTVQKTINNTDQLKFAVDALVLDLD
jgi:hypothetical protein